MVAKYVMTFGWDEVRDGRKYYKWCNETQKHVYDHDITEDEIFTEEEKDLEVIPDFYYWCEIDFYNE